MAQVTVTDDDVRIVYEVAGVSTTNFVIPCTFYANTDIKAYNNGSLISPNDYTITGNVGTTDGYEGGTLVLDTGVTNTTIVIALDITIARTVNFPVSADFSITSLNTELNRIVSMQQQLNERLNRCIKLAVTTSLTGELDLPEFVVGTPLIGYNDTGSGLALYNLADFPEALPVVTSSLANNDFLVYVSANSRFQNKTPSQVAALLGSGGALGTNIASSGTTDIGAADSNFVTVTGTTTITSLGTSTSQNHVWVKFSGALTLTHNATSLILPTGANITTVAGDIAEFARLSGGNWQCLSYVRASGTSLLPYNINSLTDTVITASDEIIFGDVSDSNIRKKDTVQGILDLMPSSASGRIPIKTITISNQASVELIHGVSGVILDSTYREYRLSLRDLVFATDNVSLRVAFSTNLGVDYEATNVAYANKQLKVGASLSAISSAAGTLGLLASNDAIGNATNEKYCGELTIFNPASTSHVYCTHQGVWKTTDGALVVSTGGCANLSTSAVNGIKIIASGGNLLSGYVVLEGIDDA